MSYGVDMYVCKQTISCNEFTKLDLDEIKGSRYLMHSNSKQLKYVKDFCFLLQLFSWSFLLHNLLRYSMQAFSFYPMGVTYEDIFDIFCENPIEKIK